MLTVLTAIGGPVVHVTGQTQNNTNASSARAEQLSLALQKNSPDDEVFVMRRNERGESVCRAATPGEKRRFSKRGDGGPARIIYPGGKRPWADELNATAPAVTETGTPLQPSAGIRIVLHGTQQLQNNPTARDAFIVAANRWEALISTPITVVIDADFGPNFFGTPFPDPGILGVTATAERNFSMSAVRQQLISNAPGPEESLLYNALPTTVPVELNGSSATSSRVRLTRPTSRALGLTPDITDPDSLPIFDGDAGIGFNSAHSFDFNPNDQITPGSLDFDAVVVHEIGHALGFTSESGAGAASPLSMWDVFRFRPGTVNGNPGTVATAPRVMSQGGNQVFFNNRVNSFNTMELALSTGGPTGQGGDGEQSSHWKNDVGGNPFIGIMDPALPSGRREMLTLNDINALDTFGYKIGGTPTPPPPPPPSPPPANDNFADAQSIFGCSGTVAGTNDSATRQSGEPNHSPDGNGGSRSVWYQWQSPSNSTVTITTAGSDFDTVLGVYTGTAFPLTLIASNDDVDLGVITSSTVTFTATSGTIYRIAVDGYNNQGSGGDEGSITLNWNATSCSTASSVSFSSAAFSVSEGVDANGIGFEGTGFRTVTVQRTGSLAVPATVDYNTSNGSADSRKDYAQSAGTLRFGQNENSKTFIVFVTDDVFQESPETVNLTLSNPVDMTLGSTPSAVLTINSNDATTGANPVDPATFNTSFFVRQHYLDFFTREPDLSGFNFWKNQIDECTTEPCREVRRINVSGAFFLSIEFQQTGYLVYRTFTTAFGPTRIGATVPLTLAEFVPDVQRIGKDVVIGQPGADALLEANKQAYFNEFVARPQFVAQYPASLPRFQFVDSLNLNAGGVLSQAERDALVNGTQTRAQVLRAVAEDSDLVNAHSNRAFVLMQYFGYMRRNPPDAPEPTLDFQGYHFWLNKLNQFNGNFVNAEMVKAFIISGEYRQRFGP